MILAVGVDPLQETGTGWQVMNKLMGKEEDVNDSSTTTSL